MKVSNLKKDKLYLLACSFGPDSMTLFTLLEQSGVNFDVAIVNYHLRKESDLEVDGLKKYCKEHNKTLHVFDVEERIEKNIENKCREIRYSFFKKLVEKNGYEAVLLAQHQDDHIETYLLQKSRQNLPKFYGIAAKSTLNGMTVIRPLLGYTKQELLDTCAKNNTPYMIDKTNLEDDFLRNKIRHEIIDKLSKEDRKKYLKEIDEANRKLKAIIRSIDYKKVHEIDYLLSLDFITYLYAINEVVKKVENAEFISKEQGQEILKILKSDKPNVIANIKTSLVLVKAYDEIYFYSQLPEYHDYSYLVRKPRKLDTPHFYLDFRQDFENRNIKLSDFPLTIRNIKDDDKFYIGGNLVTAKRVFIDWKMPLLIRKQWPVILNKDGVIVYVPRYQKSFHKDKDTNFFVKIRL